MRRSNWRHIDGIESRAAAKAINKTVRILEATFGVEAEGSSPTKRRKFVIEKIDRKMWKVSEETEEKMSMRRPVLSSFFPP